MKGSWWLRRRGPGTGATVVAKGSRHGGSSGDNRVLMAAACAPVATLMAVQRQQRVRKTKFYEGIQAERRVPDL
jgi:hypothetical protein